MLRIAAAIDPTPELARAVERLLPQLSASARPLQGDELRQILASPATTLLVARDDDAGDDEPGDDESGDDGLGLAHHREQGLEEGGPIVGLLTLAAFRIPTGVRAWIEDVVVDKAWRGRGVGDALTQAALELAAARGARTVELTSRPSREAANRLYQRVGFVVRETNVYRFDLEAQQ